MSDPKLELISDELDQMIAGNVFDEAVTKRLAEFLKAVTASLVEHDRHIQKLENDVSQIPIVKAAAFARS